MKRRIQQFETKCLILLNDDDQTKMVLSNMKRYKVYSKHRMIEIWSLFSNMIDYGRKFDVRHNN